MVTDLVSPERLTGGHLLLLLLCASGSSSPLFNPTAFLLH